MVRTMVTTHGWARLGTRVSRLVMKWVRHRCQLAPPKSVKGGDKTYHWGDGMVDHL